MAATCGLGGTASATDWRTILVAGLNLGGMGYYALDVTDPLPSGVKVLWEFTNRGVCYTDAEIAVGDKTSDCHVACRTATRSSPSASPTESGWSSSPRATTTTLAAATAGATSTFSRRIPGGSCTACDRVGTVASPSGLAKINGWATNSSVDNTVLAVYGGDLEGNLWRFQLDSSAPGYLGVVKVAAVTSAGGVAQPITVKPSLGRCQASPATA